MDYSWLLYSSTISSTAGVAGVTGAAGICISRLSEELDILFLQDAIQVSGDANVSRQLLDGSDGSISGFHIVHLSMPITPMALPTAR